VDSQKPILVCSTVPDATAARLVIEAFHQESPRLAVSGGSSLGVLSELRHQLGAAKFHRVRLCWADERCVAFDDQRSNRGTAYRSGALAFDMQPADEIALYLDGETQSNALVRVTKAFKARFAGALDYAILGLGEDGHIASLFPGYPVANERRFVAAVSNSPKPPSARITLTIKSLATATLTVVFACGARKRRAIGKVLMRDPELPTSRLKQIIVVTDQEF
jgi:6-phosphogluconolactonase